MAKQKLKKAIGYTGSLAFETAANALQSFKLPLLTKHQDKAVRHILKGAKTIRKEADLKDKKLKFLNQKGVLEAV